MTSAFAIGLFGFLFGLGAIGLAMRLADALSKRTGAATDVDPESAWLAAPSRSWLWLTGAGATVSMSGLAVLAAESPDDYVNVRVVGSVILASFFAAFVACLIECKLKKPRSQPTPGL